MREAKRFAVIEALRAGQLSIEEACDHLGVHRTTLWRLRRRVAFEGQAGLAHRLRGRPGNQRGKAEVKEEVCALYEREYRSHGFQPRHFWEEAKLEGRVGYSTVWRWLREEKLVERTRRPTRHRGRRPRKEAFGELIQMDTSVHDWLGTGEKQYLVSAIDDATGWVVGCYFAERDTVLANMRVLRDIMRNYGLPIAFYVDRSPIFKFTRTGYGRVLQPRIWAPIKTQVEQALDTLGVELIHAYTPQAKGRIERMFGTWQQRLVPELSKAGIKTLDDANEYLRTYRPKFNQRFAAKRPQDVDSAFVATMKADLNRILSEKYPRTVMNDHVVTCAPARFRAKILPGPTRASYAKTKVNILRHINGKCSIYFGDEKLRFEELDY